MLKINAASRVEKGVRGSNDDRALLCGNILNMSSYTCETETPLLAVVCDGCGGYAGGGVAAETVLETLRDAEIGSMEDPVSLANALNDCRYNVMRKKKEYPPFSEMCTTIAGCLFTDEKTLIFHAGDSRVYRFDGKYLARMTVDHSVAQEMIDCGFITEEEARRIPQRNVIVRCIGTDCAPPEIYISNVPLLPGETYLICSDGFWGSLEESEIIRLLSSELPDNEKIDSLIKAALDAGSDDNITVCICSRQKDETEEDNDDEPFVLD